MGVTTPRWGSGGVAWRGVGMGAGLSGAAVAMMGWGSVGTSVVHPCYLLCPGPPPCSLLVSVFELRAGGISIGFFVFEGVFAISGTPWCCGLGTVQRGGEDLHSDFRAFSVTSTTTIHAASGQVYVAEASLRRVLQAFCVHCPNVGYFQVRWLSGGAGMVCCSQDSY